MALALVGAGLPSLALAQGSVGDMLSRRAGQEEKSRLLVEGREIVYDRDRNTVSATGDVELNYGTRTLQADRVVYDRKTGRVHAEGNVRLSEANGTVTTSDRFELTDDFKTGFIDSLRVEQSGRDRSGPVTTRFSAARGERIDGETTTFDRGTYTACEACREDPERPPLWQVKAARIIHNNQERRIYYEGASLEFAGIPVAYVPYFYTPDPSVRRESGFLAPRYIHTKALGFGVSVPYFWAIAPDRDLTLQPSGMSRQGFLMQAEYRQRFETGAFNLRGAGIFQQGPSAFLPAPFGAGNREARGSLETTGRFNINERWHYGWDIALLSDKWFLQNYKVRSESLAANYILAESISQMYLRGQGDRSFFDLRGYYFKGLSYADWQKQLPLVAPVLDYDKRVNGPEPIGGEARLQVNVTNVSREAAQFTPAVRGNQSFPFVTRNSLNGAPVVTAYESCAVFQRGICLVRGLSGDFARVSTEASWRRTFIDDAGQSWTPFTYLRADGFFNRPDTTGYQNQQITNFIKGSDEFVGRAIPAVGLEYRYPFVSDQGRYGTHTLTPIGQVIARSNEGRIGRLPNEDAHSLVFDDSTLFDWDKFSGYDRAEGGVRANVGLQYNVTTPSGWTGNALFGQSYQLAGRNSYAQPDLLATGLGSGLESRASDFVGRIQVNPTDNFSLITRGRFDKDDFRVNSFEAQAVANLKPYIPVVASLTYARYEAQPLQGIPHRREGLQPAASLQLTPNWSIGGSVLFDLDRYLDTRDAYASSYTAYAAQFGQAAANANITYRKADLYTVAQTGLSLGYRDECTTFSINYAMTPRLATSGERESDRTVMVRLELRTLGQSSVSQNLATASSADGIASR
ncbi:LPS-assembly protein LptD [Enterovirga sp.]|uniref:LPS-assembly protein LptD n=1 Tax=Enterovirga sp. TaxID=2026350 RepID=UPI002604A2AC|nr:LPS-assembly protein LptD [Enterovirga sp.]